MTPILSIAVTRIRAFADRIRDWRIRTLVPVIGINLLVFACLYALMVHFGLSNLVTTHKFGAMILLDDVEMTFDGDMLAHRADLIEDEVSRLADTHDLLSLTIYNAIGEPVVNSRRPPQNGELAQARTLLDRPGPRTQWFISDDQSTVTFGRMIENPSQCHACHSPALSRLGVIQLSIDLRKPAAEVASRVRRNFAAAGTIWIGLLALMFWTGGRVIGRPLAQIEKTMSVAAGRSTAPHDLQSLAHRLHGTLEVIDRQRQREAAMAKQMARAEQLAALGELAAGLTHEIKNPLAGVIAALELLQSDSETTNEQRDLYEQMLSELKRVSNTLSSLLRLARPQPPLRTSVDLARVVREVTMLFSARLRRQGVALALDISEPIPTLQLDPGLMIQLLVNLLTNSLQACDRDGTVTVTLGPFPLHDGVMLSVADTGKGIDAANLERIFDPFFTTKDEGTGLGLPICRQIVEQHGGTITIESEPGKGTRVTVLLPATVAKATEEPHGIVAVG